METVFIAKQFLHRIDFQELRATALAHVTTQISYLVVFLHIAFLSQHTHRSQEQALAVNLSFLINGNHTIAQGQQSLQLVVTPAMRSIS